MRPVDRATRPPEVAAAPKLEDATREALGAIHLPEGVEGQLMLRDYGVLLIKDDFSASLAIKLLEKVKEKLGVK